jgi:prepilin-type N-terminal cleavage/methylation domain-containing protein
MRTRERKAGFTLVELLVVITIITLLISLLLPALRRAREAGYRAKCLSGARQVGLAVQSYCGDFREYYPAGGFSGAFAPFDPPYQEKLVKGGYASQDAFTKRGGCPYGPDIYYDNAGNDSYNGSISLGWPFCTISYGLNVILQSGWGLAATGPFGTMETYGPQKQSGEQSSRYGPKLAVIVCNLCSWRSDYANPNVPYVSLTATLGYPITYAASDMDPRTPRHNSEGLPMGMADGHAEFVPRDEVLSRSILFPGSKANGPNLMDVSFGMLDRSGAYGWKP